MASSIGDGAIGGAVAAMDCEEEESMPEASTTGPVSFDADIRPLFRDRDREAMRRAFDLFSREDVLAHASAIEAQLKAGTMPCDGAWPADRVALFASWVEQGGAE